MDNECRVRQRQGAAKHNFGILKSNRHPIHKGGGYMRNDWVLASNDDSAQFITQTWPK